MSDEQEDLDRKALWEYRDNIIGLLRSLEKSITIIAIELPALIDTVASEETITETKRLIDEYVKKWNKGWS